MRINQSVRILTTTFIVIVVILTLVPPTHYSVSAHHSPIDLPTFDVPDLPTYMPTPDMTRIAPILTPSCDHWKVEIDLPYSPGDVQDMGGIKEGLSQLEQQFAPGIQLMPVKYKVVSASSGSGGAVYTITVEGSGVELLKTVLYDKLAKIVDILDLPIGFALSGNAKAGTTLKILLSLIPSIGKKWSLDDLSGQTQKVSSEIECISHVAPGSPETQTLLVNILKDGMVALNLIYGRVWEKAPIKPPVRITLNLCNLSDLLNLANPYLNRLNQAAPSAPAGNVGSGGQSSQFDWASSNNRTGTSQMTSVKDQKNCGGCWAFTSVGVMEAAIKIQGGGGDTDLAEQYLISCNNDGWSCNGGWWAHDYHISKNGLQNNPPGAVLESAFPYLGQNGTCKLVSNHPYLLASWHSVGMKPWVPSRRLRLQLNSMAR